MIAVCARSGALGRRFKSTWVRDPRAVNVAVTKFGAGDRITTIDVGGVSFDARATVGVSVTVGGTGVFVGARVGVTVGAIVAVGGTGVAVAATIVRVGDGGTGVEAGAGEHAASATSIAQKKIFFISSIGLDPTNNKSPRLVSASRTGATIQ